MQLWWPFATRGRVELHNMYQSRFTVKNSWWWAERLPETCRVVIPLKLELSASVGLILKQSVTMQGHTVLKLQVKLFSLLQYFITKCFMQASLAEWLWNFLNVTPQRLLKECEISVFLNCCTFWDNWKKNTFETKNRQWHSPEKKNPNFRFPSPVFKTGVPHIHVPSTGWPTKLQAAKNILWKCGDVHTLGNDGQKSKLHACRN